MSEQQESVREKAGAEDDEEIGSVADKQSKERAHEERHPSGLKDVYGKENNLGLKNIKGWH